MPDGLIAGKPLDVILSVADLNPEVPGLGLKEVAIAKVYLPDAVVNPGNPVSKPGKSDSFGKTV